MVRKNPIKGTTADYSALVEVFESLILWPEPWVAITLAALIISSALLNIIFTSFIAYEQVTMLHRELRFKDESMRVERYLKIKYAFKNRIWYRLFA